MAHVAYLSQTIGAREQGTQGEAAAAAYVSSQLASYGLGVTSQQAPITFNGRTTTNVIARVPGRGGPGRVMVLGAHLDTKGGPGANDDATGVAVLLELARVTRNNEARALPGVRLLRWRGG